jgi:ElaB/YqjD/DUF883 family membrane-anchored ribosome-binding protein
MSISEADMKSGRINDQLGEQLESMSARVEANVERGRNLVADWQANLNDTCARAYEEANRFVHERPWEATVAATLLGVVMGLLCSSSSRRR